MKNDSVCSSGRNYSHTAQVNRFTIEAHVDRYFHISAGRPVDICYVEVSSMFMQTHVVDDVNYRPRNNRIFIYRDVL